MRKQGKIKIWYHLPEVCDDMVKLTVGYDIIDEPRSWSDPGFFSMDAFIIENDLGMANNDVEELIPDWEEFKKAVLAEI